MKPVRILIATGATGGHLFPAVSLIETLQACHPEAEIHLVLNRAPEFARSALSKLPVRLHVIEFRPPKALFSLMAFQILIEYARAFWNTVSLLDVLKPKVVIGFGSFGSVPAVLCAACLGIPIVIHEQNASAGRANRFLSYWADLVAVSFPETKGLPAQKTLWTGFPVRAAFFNGRPQGERQKAFTILVFGGSQGARRINAVFLEALGHFGPEEKAQFAVIHIIGPEAPEPFRKSYQDLGINARVFSFSEEMEQALARADVVISRAGAGTIFELAAVGRAAILIPYPYAYAHQERNADYLLRRGWARVLRESELTAEKLYRDICQLREQVDLRRAMASGVKTLRRPDAALALMETAWKL